MDNAMEEALMLIGEATAVLGNHQDSEFHTISEIEKIWLKYQNDSRKREVAIQSEIEGNHKAKLSFSFIIAISSFD